MLKEYEYRGPVDSGATIRLPDGSEIDVVFRRGRRTPPLPDDNPYVLALVAQKILIPAPETVAQPIAPAPKAPQPAGEANGS